MGIAAKAGGISYGFAKEKFKISLRRLNDLASSGYLEKHVVYKVEKEKVEARYVFDLGEKGKNYVKEANVCTKTQGFNGYKHLLKTEEVVYKLLYEEEINIKNILNEKEQMDIFDKEISAAKIKGVDFRVNDLAIINGDFIESIEIDTGYSKKLKQQHKNYSELVLGVEYKAIY